jgi:hypothetical protein
MGGVELQAHQVALDLVHFEPLGLAKSEKEQEQEKSQKEKDKLPTAGIYREVAKFAKNC